MRIMKLGHLGICEQQLMSFFTFGSAEKENKQHCNTRCNGRKPGMFPFQFVFCYIRSKQVLIINELVRNLLNKTGKNLGHLFDW